MLWNRHCLTVFTLVAVVGTSYAAMNHADALYILTGVEDSAIVLDDETDTADLSSQLVFLSSNSTGYDVTLTAGQRAQITLADGTKVWLNSESTLSYRSDFGRRDRDVELDGEAYFEVAKNKEIPFYVNTETNQVRVVGTHFNVCAYKGSNEFETTLVEGIVDIYAYDNERPLTRLTKNEFFGSYQGKYKKAVLPSYDYLRWREGLYCFDDSPFSCILTKLEKYYNVKITVENPKVLNYRCTGKFKEQDGVEHILKVIQKDHPFTYSISEEGDSIRIE